MWSKNAGDCPSAIVGLLDSEGAYRGTGFFVSRRLILTCEHVVLGSSTIAARRLLGGQGLTFRLLYTDPDRDLAILELELGEEEGDPIPLLAGLPPARLRTFDGRLATIGVEASTGKPLRLDNLSLRLVVGSVGAADEVVREAQIDGGAPKGLSGSPVFAPSPTTRWACVGMMVLGGSDSGQSLLRGPDMMLAFCEESGVRSGVESRSAIEALTASTHQPAVSDTGTLADATDDFESWAHQVRSSRARRRKTIASCALMTFTVAGLTLAGLRTFGPSPTPPPAWIPNELFPAMTELLGRADNLQQFSRVYLLATPKNHLGYKQQVADLNKYVRAFNCTSDFLLSGKNLFRDKLSAVRPEKLKDLVVRISEPRFPARYASAVYEAPAIGPSLPGAPSAQEKFQKDYKELVFTWSENATQLDGPYKETVDYLAELEKELLHALILPVPKCAP
jgi:hypothetical protein